MRYLLILFFLLLSVASVHAQTASSYPKGKAIVTLFGDAHAAFQKVSSPQWGFDINRAYLGYQYELNANWKGKIIFDMGKGDDSKLQRVALLKNAEIDYHKAQLTVNMGVTATALYLVQEKFWGLRYVYKSFMDERGWQSSADLGIYASYDFSNMLSVDASIYNGEGYKKIQNDNQLQYGLGLTFKPVETLVLRAYTDFKTGQDAPCQQNVALFAGYQTQSFRIGAEYNMELNHANGDGQNLYGVSVYGASRMSPKTELYARYDYEKASNGWEYENNKRHTGILGVDLKVNPIFSVSPNVRLNKYDGQNSQLYACVSGKVSF